MQLRAGFWVRGVQIKGEPAKIVTERLGHSTAAYTQDAYQEVMPGMQRDAARRFGQRLQRPLASSDDGAATDGQDGR
jgi:integrase